jgi:hypothetical protein
MAEREGGETGASGSEHANGPNQPATVAGRHRDDRRLNEHGQQSADDSGPHAAEGEGEGAADLDAEIARRESGGTRRQPGTGLGAGLVQRPPD